MSELHPVPAPMTRRDLMKGAVALATVSVGHALPDSDATAAPRSRARRAAHGGTRHRVAIIGAGAGGVAAAYLFGGAFDVEIFEARSKIGGHCDSHSIRYRGRRVTVDLGAQFFHPDTHPIYVTLLEEVGLYDPAHPGAGPTLEAPASLCIFPTAGGPPTFSSLHPFSTLQRAIEFASFAGLARQAVLSDLPWEMTLGAWIGSLPVSQSFKNQVLSPWITALIGCPRAQMPLTSARAILQTFALSFSANVAQGATTYNSTIGLQGNLQRLLHRSHSVRVHLDAATQALKRTRAGWFVTTRAGQRGPYRFVVLNAPPLVGRRLLHRFADLRALLHEYEYFDSRLVIHADPIYMDRRRAEWAVYNAGGHGRECEGSVWLGALHPKLSSGGTIDVFKSWAERRRADPRKILLERHFKHPLITQPAIQAARALQPRQGHAGLYFSGQYTTGFDSQESAVYSAMKVAESLAPGSPTLASLKTRLAARGFAGISYDV